MVRLKSSFSTVSFKNIPMPLFCKFGMNNWKTHIIITDEQAKMEDKYWLKGKTICVLVDLARIRLIPVISTQLSVDAY